MDPIIAETHNNSPYLFLSFSMLIFISVMYKMLKIPNLLGRVLNRTVCFLIGSASFSFYFVALETIVLCVATHPGNKCYMCLVTTAHERSNPVYASEHPMLT